MTTFAASTLSDGSIEASTAEERAPERRQGPDRRLRPTPMLSRYTFFGGRRQNIRRREEREGAFVDRHGAGVLFMVGSILALNLLDAFFTLLFLSYGGEEMNPLVQAVLDLGGHPWPFLLLKTVGIGVLSTFLVLTKNFRSARIGLWVVFVGYSALLCWHLWLYCQLPAS